MIQGQKHLVVPFAEARGEDRMGVRRESDLGVFEVDHAAEAEADALEFMTELVNKGLVTVRV